MSNAASRSLSRRSVLAGTGGLLGAAAVAAAGDPAAAQVPMGPDDPTTGPGSQQAAGGPPQAAAPPGYTTKSWSEFDFHPNNYANGKSVSSSGAYCTVANGFLVAGLDLPHGAQLVDVLAYATNTSGFNRSVFVESQPLAGGAATELGSAVLASGTGVRPTSIALSHTVDRVNNAYDAGMYTYADGSVRIWSARIGYVPAEQGFQAVTPRRVYDSRAGNPPLDVTKGQLANATRAINCLKGMMIAGSAVRGVLANVTVVNTSASGFLALYRNGLSFPGTSSINWFVANEVVANTIYIEVDSAGLATALVPAGSSTDFIVDVVGLYR